VHDAAIDAVLAHADDVYADLRHRKAMVDPDTPAAVEARLVYAALGFRPAGIRRSYIKSL
jgi:hypothetical protein